VGIPASSRASLNIPDAARRDFFCRIPTWSYIVVALLAAVVTHIVWQVYATELPEKVNGSVLLYPVGAVESFIVDKMAEL
jgi:hypothetical protein